MLVNAMANYSKCAGGVKCPSTFPAARDIMAAREPSCRHPRPVSSTCSARWSIGGRSIAREAEIILKPLGHSLDWLAFADAWRGEYQPAMEEIRSGRHGVLQARRAAPAQSRKDPAALQDRRPVRGRDAPSQSGLAPARRLAGFRAGPGAAQEEVPDRAGVERQYFADGRSRAPQQFSLGCDPRLRDRRRLQAEAAGLSRGLRGVRSCRPAIA